MFQSNGLQLYSLVWNRNTVVRMKYKVKPKHIQIFSTDKVGTKLDMVCQLLVDLMRGEGETQQRNQLLQWINWSGRNLFLNGQPIIRKCVYREHERCLIHFKGKNVIELSTAVYFNPLPTPLIISLSVINFEIYSTLAKFMKKILLPTELVLKTEN